MTEQDDVRVAVSISRKINLGDYESVDIFMSVSGLEVGVTGQEIEEALATGQQAFTLLSKRIRARMDQVRAGKSSLT